VIGLKKKKNLKISTRRKKCGKTSEVVEGFSHVIPITGLSRPDTGMDTDNNENRHVP
jgi:hypothetical protein